MEMRKTPTGSRELGFLNAGESSVILGQMWWLMTDSTRAYFNTLSEVVRELDVQSTKTKSQVSLTVAEELVLQDGQNVEGNRRRRRRRSTSSHGGLDKENGDAANDTEDRENNTDENINNESTSRPRKRQTKAHPSSRASPGHSVFKEGVLTAVQVLLGYSHR